MFIKFQWIWDEQCAAKKKLWEISFPHSCVTFVRLKFDRKHETKSDNDMRQVWRWLLIFRPNGRWQIITCWNRRFLQRLTGGKSTQCWHHFFYFCYYIHSFCNLIHVLRNSNPIDLVNGMDGFYLHYTNKYDTVVFINVISGIIFLCFVHWLDNLVHQITKQ